MKPSEMQVGQLRLNVCVVCDMDCEILGRSRGLVLETR